MLPMTQFLLPNFTTTLVVKQLNPAIIVTTFNVKRSLMTTCHQVEYICRVSYFSYFGNVSFWVAL